MAVIIADVAAVTVVVVAAILIIIVISIVGHLVRVGSAKMDFDQRNSKHRVAIYYVYVSCATIRRFLHRFRVQHHTLYNIDL